MSDDTQPGLGKWPVAVRGIKVAWGDMDAFGHVNNTVYLKWFETGRIAYFEAIGLTAEMRETGQGPILARTSCDFRLPLAYPDSVDVLTTVKKMGNTSFVMGYRVYSHEHKGALAAVGEGIIVLYDYGTQAKVALPDALRTRIKQVEASGG